MVVSRKIGVTMKETTITRFDPVFLDVTKAPFELFGFSDGFHRLPTDVAEATSEKVALISKYSCGCRLRFKTTSDYIVVHAEIGESETVATMPIVATSGFDVYFYDNGKYYFKGSFCNSQGAGKTFVEARLMYDNDDMKDVVIDFPITSEIKSMHVALREGCELDAPSKYI